jgi:6-phosphogluconolactonase
MDFYKVNDSCQAAKYLSKTIKLHLENGEKVLWLLAGGSAINVANDVSKELRNTSLSNLSATLTDERFVPSSSEDSNWQQLMSSGFDLPGAHLYPVLVGGSIDQTTHAYANILEELFNNADYSIGFFGIGSDGHIAALFPHHPALSEPDNLATYLDNSPKPPKNRISMTIKAIKKLDEAIIFAMGDEKRHVIEKLKEELLPEEQPAQILKSLPKLTIFNDQIGESI